MTTNVEQLEGGNNDGALFLGIEEGDRVFWDYRTDELVKEGVAETFQLDGEFVGDYIADATGRGLWGRSSRLGAFLEAAAKHADTPGMLGRKQATVFAIRDLGGISRTHAARALDMNKSTLDTTLQTARMKVDAFRAVGEALTDE